MSFADDLRKMEPIKENNHAIEDYHVRHCLWAIKSACLENKKMGKNYIHGGMYCDENDYKILDNYDGTVFRMQELSFYEYIKKELIKGIKELGFSRFNVTIKDTPLTEYAGQTFTGKDKYRKTGKIGHSFYIDIEW